LAFQPGLPGERWPGFSAAGQADAFLRLRLFGCCAAGVSLVSPLVRLGLGCANHRQDAGLDRLRQVVPSGHDSGQIRVFCATHSANVRGSTR